ncbi:MAG: family 10 glycosylhydrolase [Fimbriimonas sp.]|nr:family 10 glycosylhydrolase [Fimbriimonas sp.]
MCLLAVVCLGLFHPAGLSSLTLDSCRYVSTADARSSWTPSDGGQPVEMAERGIRLPFDVTGNHARAYWDRSLSVDLSRVDRIRFSFYVQDSTRQSTAFSFYFQSDRGWYSADFTAEPGWNKITLGKAVFRTEGTVTGWDHITGIRIGAWKTVDAASSLGLSGIEALSSDIVVVLGDRTPNTSPEFGAVESQAKTVSGLLDSMGIEAGGLTDRDVERGALTGRRIAIFAFSPDMSGAEIAEVRKFVEDGGHIFAFYNAPAPMLKLIGVESIGWKGQERPGLFSAIRFVPGTIPELPSLVHQASWNVDIVKPLQDSAHVIGGWVDADGKDIGVPALVASPTGVYMSHVLLGDDVEGKQAMMLALLGYFDADVWKEACDRTRAGCGMVGDAKSIDEAIAKLGKPATATATRQYEAGIASAKNGQYAEAIRQFRSAHTALVAAYCTAAPGKGKEMRAVWCHSAFGVPGRSWDQVANKLAEAGFNMIVPNMLWGGRAYYPSKVLPVDESLGKSGDQIKLCLEAAHRHGLQVHVWKVCWNLSNAPQAFLERMRSEGRTQKSPAGQDIDWLCPSNPANFEMERDAMLEIARSYAVDGIHFDYIRYPDSDGCYCDGCRKRFEEASQIRIAHWPQDVITGSYADSYRQFRRSNITRLVKAVSTEARRIRPGIQVSAAVFADWPACRDTVGQDWVSWVKSGYLDFVCPMDYTGSATQYEQWMINQTSAVGRFVRFCPGVGVTLDSTLAPDQVVRQIELGRRHGSAGFILFNLNEALLQQILPFLRAGISRPMK